MNMIEVLQAMGDLETRLHPLSPSNSEFRELIVLTKWLAQNVRNQEMQIRSQETEIRRLRSTEQAVNQ
jgi:hypothetical protein